MYEKFILRVEVSPLEGFFGCGETVEKARANCIKAMPSKYRRRKVKESVSKFTSELPFAPSNREAMDKEADAWCGKDGSINWLRCERYG